MLLTPPIGIVEPLPTHGIFPLLTDEERERAAKGYAPAQSGHELWDTMGNDKSYEEFQSQADAELRLEFEAGFVFRGRDGRIWRTASAPWCSVRSGCWSNTSRPRSKSGLYMTSRTVA